MKHFPTLFVAAMCLAGASAGTGLLGEPSPNNSPTSQTTTALDVATVHEHLAWLVGYWVGEGLGGVSEEAWLPPRSGQMMGVFRLITEEGLQFSETLTIGEFENGIELRLKHFDPQLHGWEEKNDVTSFPFKSSEPGHTRFGGLEFIREGDKAMRIELKLRRDEQVSTEVFRFTRQVLEAGS